jgi:hypothetical protein
MAQHNIKKSVEKQVCQKDAFLHDVFTLRCTIMKKLRLENNLSKYVQGKSVHPESICLFLF